MILVHTVDEKEGYILSSVLNLVDMSIVCLTESYTLSMTNGKPVGCTKLHLNAPSHVKELVGDYLVVRETPAELNELIQKARRDAR